MPHECVLVPVIANELHDSEPEIRRVVVLAAWRDFEDNSQESLQVQCVQLADFLPVGLHWHVNADVLKNRPKGPEEALIGQVGLQRLLELLRRLQVGEVLILRVRVELLDNLDGPAFLVEHRRSEGFAEA